MKKNWKEIWGQRELNPAGSSVLAQLMAADGFDTGFGNMEEGAWRGFVAEVVRRLKMKPEDSIFDVGCGAGAFLKPLYDDGRSVGGLDYSRALLEIAQEVMPDIETQHGEAIALEVEPKFDAVVSCGVFLYFPDLDYARGVLELMAKKARRSIAILDVPDASCREEAMAIRKGNLGDEEYEAKYDGLDHLYYDREWFGNVLGELGASDVRTESQFIEGYANAAYRFNVFADLPGE